MSGQITHSWNGTVLTITSDAGISSCDLKGDTGCRGPQGPHGIVYDADGNIIMEGFATEQYVNDLLKNLKLEGYATTVYVDNAVSQINLTGYATENFVSTSIAKAQLEGAGVDTSGFATKDDLAEIDCYTKDEIDAMFASLSGTNFTSAEEVEY